MGQEQVNFLSANAQTDMILMCSIAKREFTCFNFICSKVYLRAKEFSRRRLRAWSSVIPMSTWKEHHATCECKRRVKDATNLQELATRDCHSDLYILWVVCKLWIRTKLRKSHTRDQRRRIKGEHGVKTVIFCSLILYVYLICAYSPVPFTGPPYRSTIPVH